MLRFQVWMTELAPVVGSEMGKTRPCVIISPDEANRRIATVILAPLTSVRRNWPSRVPVRFKRRGGDVALDQMQAMDKSRLKQRVGMLSSAEAQAVLDCLSAMFKS